MRFAQFKKKRKYAFLYGFFFALITKIISGHIYVKIRKITEVSTSELMDCQKYSNQLLHVQYRGSLTNKTRVFFIE